MQMTMRYRGLLLPVLMATALESCDREEAPAPVTALAPPSAKPAPAPTPVAAVPPAEDHGPDGSAANDNDMVVATGEWSEAKQYKFRLERVASCGAPAATLGPAQPTAPSATSAFKGETTWVGALFSVQSKDKTLFVSPRDLELRRGGVILNARHINQPLLPGCKPLLPAKPLRAGEDVSGFALFEVPKSFRTTTEDPIVLSYKPTRWGGARRVEVPIRECLDACPESSASRAGKTAGRSAPVSRPKL
jgi:hypothetical protein